MRLFSYIDGNGCLRGPFCEVQMHYWYLQNYLQPSLVVIMHEDGMGRQITLGQLIFRNGDANPFDDATLYVFDTEKHSSIKEKESRLQIMEAFDSYNGETVYPRNNTNSVIAGCDKVAPGYFSYIDKHGCLRGPFSAERMQRWYEEGFFADDFEVFAHRGRVADHFTLENLCKYNGDDTPFIFSQSLECVNISGFLERPPGFSFKERSNKRSLDKSVQCPPRSKFTSLLLHQTENGSATITQHEKDSGQTPVILQNPFRNWIYTAARSNGYGGYLRRLTEPRGSSTASSSPDLTKSDDHLFRSMQHSLAERKFKNREKVQLKVSNYFESQPAEFFRGTIHSLQLSQEEADKYKPWPLLSRQEKNHSEVKKESWVMNNFRFLQKHVSQCDLENINKDPNNYDLFGAVCQLCCVRLPAASEVFKHLALESHQNKVLLECQITGPEFYEYFNRLKNVRLKAVQLVDEMIDSSTSSARNKKNEPKSAPNTKNKPTSLPNTKNEPTSPDTFIMLMQAAPQRSQELTDEELEAEMEELRKLASTVNHEKFINLYKYRINTYKCAPCKKRTQGPMEVLAHYLSSHHYKRVRRRGFRATTSDIDLWRSQILAAI
uniref:GYF domain-containing protein n=1 Tax=Haemonchus contortus TaxID=6289 RepID=A0A7I5EBA5_HAECO